MRTTIILVAGLLVSTAAIAGGGDKTKTGTMDKTGTGMGTATKGTLTEAQALGVMLAANSGEVSIGQAVAARTTNPEVRRYAMQLVDHHMAANKDLLGITEKAGAMVPMDSPLRDQLSNDVHKELTNLWSREAGADFDKMFLTAAIEDHAAHLKLIDQQLMPAVTTANLKDELTAMRATIADHLKDACGLATPMGVQSTDCAQQRGTE
ncbi:MAG: DUF4142 domain-containing protein [Myxococcota bacterium]